MDQDHARSVPHAADTLLNKQATPARPIAYNEALAFKICERFGNGESLEAILAEPGMPEEETFCRWRVEHKETARQFRAKKDLHEMLAEQKKELELQKKQDLSEARYRARPWEEVYPMIGSPPVLSTENAQAYADLLTAFTEMLQPQDIMAQILVKQAADATWDEVRAGREKTQVPERAYQE